MESDVLLEGFYLGIFEDNVTIIYDAVNDVFVEFQTDIKTKYDDLERIREVLINIFQNNE